VFKKIETEKVLPTKKLPEEGDKYNSAPSALTFEKGKNIRIRQIKIEVIFFISLIFAEECPLFLF
jgi:hypothetical protein